MNNDLLPVISELNKVKNIREKMTEFVSLSIQCSDPVDYVSSERVFPMDIITGANYFMFSNPDIPRLLMSNIFTVEESKLTHIFNEKDYMHKGRYTFPIFDIYNRVMALASWSPNKRHKYLTSRTFGFKESCQFYGMEQFNNAIRHGFAIVVEGYFDRLRWIQSGYDNVLCVMSNELSPYKRMILDRLPKVIFVPDGDEYGKANSLLSTNVKFKDSFKWYTNREFVRLELPDKFNGKQIKDTDDLVKSHIETMDNTLHYMRQWIDLALSAKSGTVLKMTEN